METLIYVYSHFCMHIINLYKPSKCWGKRIDQNQLLPVLSFLLPFLFPWARGEKTGRFRLPGATLWSLCTGHRLHDYYDHNHKKNIIIIISCSYGCKLYLLCAFIVSSLFPSSVSFIINHHQSTILHFALLVGGIPIPLKNMSSSVGMMNFPIWWESHKIPWFQSPIS